MMSGERTKLAEIIHSPPGHIGMSLADFRWNVLRGLTDYLRVSEHRVYGSVVTPEILEGHATDIILDLPDGAQDILQVEQVGTVFHT
jgi:hypothetical protein